jgi:general secretion pathway protein D
MKTPAKSLIRGWCVATGLVLFLGDSAANEPASAMASVLPPIPQPAGSEAQMLWRRGRSQYLAGEPAAAARTLTRLLEIDPANAGARSLLQRIAADTVGENVSRTQTVVQMLNEVERAWQRPVASTESPGDAAPAAPPSPLLDKLNAIVVPGVNFNGVELKRVVDALNVLAEESDPTGQTPKGLNLVLLDPAGAGPEVSVTLRHLSLKRVLDLITESVGYRYDIQGDAVVIRPGGGPAALDTRFFAVSRATVLRLTGHNNLGAGGPGRESSAGRAAAAPPAVPSAEQEGNVIRTFLQLAGVNFAEVPGSTLAFDGSQLIVTQTPRNLERIHNILVRYRDVRQVEIEARFMEVQDGALEELGVNWSATKKPSALSGLTVSTYATNNRSLIDAFSYQGTHDNLTISAQPATSETTAGSVTTPGLDLSLPVAPPGIPGGVSLGPPGAALATVAGIFGEFSVNAVVRALSQKSGTELLSSPKLTVLSGNQATITVAQELRYPQAYGQVQSQVGTGNTVGGGSAGVTITAGTPQDFATRDIGVELRVTPTVEEDDRSITLDLNPKVTEFEGFVEYGGASVAISSGTTVTVPSGFYQPIFAVRDITTKVTIWDGATLVMGGLTREDVKTTNDKVPVLGNVPVLGRLFRSNGASAQKRNLLIFVTANLVNPGGSLKKMPASGPSARSLFQHPTIVTPAGPVERGADKR